MSLLTNICHKIFCASILFMSLIGLLYIINGIVALVGRETDYLQLPFNQTYEIIKHIFYIVVGIIGIIVSGIGLKAAFSKSEHWKYGFAVGAITLLIATIIFGSIIFKFDGSEIAITDARTYSTKIFRNPNYYEEIINNMQRQIQCCGDRGPDFWDTLNVPMSCCIANEKKLFGQAETVSWSCNSYPTLRHARGCNDALVERLLEVRAVEGIFSLLFGLTILIALICVSGFLIKYIENQTEITQV